MSAERPPPSIFVTVGTDLPFDRLLKAVDAWASGQARPNVFAQIGEGAWEPERIEFAHFLEPPEFKRRFAEATVIVAHAGMGTILSALREGKPILVMPRRASLGEQRNEHQLATAQRMLELGTVNVAFDDDELEAKLNRLQDLDAPPRISSFASERIVKRIREFVFESNSHEG